MLHDTLDLEISSVLILNSLILVFPSTILRNLEGFSLGHNPNIFGKEGKKN